MRVSRNILLTLSDALYHILNKYSVFSYSDCEVFPKNHAAPFSKVLTFYRKEPFTLEAYYSSPKELPYPDPAIG